MMRIGSRRFEVGAAIWYLELYVFEAVHLHPVNIECASYALMDDGSSIGLPMWFHVDIFHEK